MSDTPEERLKWEHTKQKIAEINESVRAENERAKKEHKLLRPYWANFFPDGKSFQEVCVFPDLCDIDQLGYKPESIEKNNHPLLSKYGKGGTLALGAMAASDEQYLEWSFRKIDSFFNEEMNKGKPKAAEDLTPKQVAILELEEQLAFLQCALAQDGNNYQHIAEAVSFGAALMRLAIVFPEGDQEQMFQMIRDTPARVMELWIKATGPKPSPGKPPKHKEKKMHSAYRLIDRLITGGATQKEAAEETNRRRKLDLGWRHLIDGYREWKLPERYGKKKT